jgi:hypothetical protein
MATRACGLDKVTVRLVLTLAAVLTVPPVLAQTLRVTAANSSAPDAVYDVLFNPTETTLLNADGNSFQRFHSLVFVPNAATGGVDLVVADTTGGVIVRYFGPTGTPTVSSTVVWRAASNIPGPRQPDGLSADAAGNLYVVTSTSSSGKPQLWVLPATPITPGAPTGYLAPVLLDGWFNRNEVDALVETIVVRDPTTTAARMALKNAGIGVGDLLVLVSDSDALTNDGGRHDLAEPELVYHYPAWAIQQVITGAAASVSPTIVLSWNQFPYSSGARPNGMDIWADGSLLISTSAGEILQFALGTMNSPTTFAAISCGTPPCPFYKLRTGTQTGTAYAFVTQSTAANGGNVLEFAAPMSMPTPTGGFGFTVPKATVATSASTTGSPRGLALAPPTVVLASTATCTSPTGCNPTGGLSHLIVPGPAGVGPEGVHGNLVEQTCIINDTRLQQDGTCPGNLSIAAQCPGFPANFIPPTICGASGPAGNQLAIIETIANGVDDVEGILVQSQESPGAIIPGTKDTGFCPLQQVLGWAPRLGSNEGTIPEGGAVVDITGYCDSGGGSTRGNSIWTIGGQLSPTVSTTTHELIGYANQKLIHVGQTVDSANIAAPVRERLDECLEASAVLLDTGHHVCAARKVWKCDQVVGANPNSFRSSPGNPNPYGDIRGRLGNLYFTINTRILHNTPNSTWPLANPPPRCNADEDEEE